VLLPAEAGQATAVPVVQPFISARGVTKRFGGPAGVLALDRVDLDIRPGEFVSLLGPSGCGKSTFLRCLAGLEKPSGGLLSLADEPITAPPKGLGIALQRDALLEWADVLDNVLLPADFAGLPRRDHVARARQLLSMVGLSDFLHAYPHTLSGGMRQRVAICRSLLLRPSLLLMDEPFGALDAMTRDQLNVDLHRLWREQRMTVVFVTHSISEALFLSTRVVVLAPRPGRLVDDIKVELPEHRRLAVRETPEFGALSRQLRGRFEAMGLLHE
jgi:NitT/TauT family transport system ATP-binding protein